MKHLKKFNELFEDKYNYSKIVNNLIKAHGWGNGVITLIDEFENNEEYFLYPVDDNDYIEKFHVFLTDKTNNSLRGGLSKNLPLKLGKWKGEVSGTTPIPIYNKLT